MPIGCPSDGRHATLDPGRCSRQDERMDEGEELTSADPFQFDFFEVVGIADSAESTGTVLGRVRDDDGTEWYSLAVDGRADLISVEGARLHPTGEHRQREDFYDGSTLRVSVEGEELDDL